MTSLNDFFKSAALDRYVNWALGVCEPMTIKYQKDKHFVSVKIPSNFISTDVCKECETDGPHHGKNHVFKIIVSQSDGETKDMMIFNDNEQCSIQQDTDAFKTLKQLVSKFGSITEKMTTCYFYGKPDDDDRCSLYIKISELPPQ